MTTVTRVSHDIDISDQRSHYTYATHETSAHDKLARKARTSVLSHRCGSDRATGPARHASGSSAARLSSSCAQLSMACRSRAHIARTLTMPREPTAITLSGARRELILGLLVGHAEAVAAEVVRRPLVIRRVRSRHRKGGSRASAQRTASLRRRRSNARPAQVAIGPGAQNRATWWPLENQCWNRGHFPRNQPFHPISYK